MPGVHHQQHEAADEGAEHGAEGGQQVEHGYHEGYEAHVGHAHDGHEKGVGAAHDQAVQQVEDDVPVQDGVAAPQDLGQLLVLGPAQGGGQQPLAPVLQPGLVAQQVDGQQKAHQELDRPLAHAGGGGQDLAQILLHEVSDGLDEGLGGVDELVQPQSRGGHAQGIQHGVEGGHVPVQVPGEGGHALDELGDEHQQQEHQEQDHRQNGQEVRKEGLRLLLLDPAEQGPSVEPRQGVHDIGDDGAQDHRREVPEEGAHALPHAAPVGQQHEQDHGDAQGHRVIIPGLFPKSFVHMVHPCVI